MTAEKNIQTLIEIELCQHGCIVHREQSGVFWTGVLAKHNGNNILTNLRRVTIGCVGKADLQGHTATGKCFYIECKKLKGNRAEAQERFIESMKKSGALAGFAESIEDALAIIKNY
jgi:hypothetical protein